MTARASKATAGRVMRNAGDETFAAAKAALAPADGAPKAPKAEKAEAVHLTRALARKAAQDVARKAKDKTGQVFSPVALANGMRDEVTLQVREAIAETIKALQDLQDNLTADGITLSRKSAVATSVRAKVYAQQRNAGFGGANVSIEVSPAYAFALAAQVPVEAKPEA